MPLRSSLWLQWGFQLFWRSCECLVGFDNTSSSNHWKLLRVPRKNVTFKQNTCQDDASKLKELNIDGRLRYERPHIEDRYETCWDRLKMERKLSSLTTFNSLFWLFWVVEVTFIKKSIHCQLWLTWHLMLRTHVGAFICWSLSRRRSNDYALNHLTGTQLHSAVSPWRPASRSLWPASSPVGRGSPTRRSAMAPLPASWAETRPQSWGWCWCCLVWMHWAVCWARLLSDSSRCFVCSEEAGALTLREEESRKHSNLI